MQSLLADAIDAPVLVVAPHPDDESLSCGGLIALLRRRSKQVHVIVVTDGGASHPASRTWPRERLARLREQEASAALRHLGVAPFAQNFWHEPDAALPGPGEPGFGMLVDQASASLRARRARTVVAPWRYDPHRDHRAASAIFRAALRRTIRPIRLLEYPGWTGMFPDPSERPRRVEIRRWQLRVGSAASIKRRSVDLHRSQLGRVVDDDPDGFVLTPALRRHFEHGCELYWEHRS